MMQKINFILKIGATRDNIFLSFSNGTTVLELEVLVLVYVHSLRQSLFTMYRDALTELVPGSMP